MSTHHGWRDRTAGQQPRWPDSEALRLVSDELTHAPPLVHPAECDELRGQLAQVARGEAFLLQGGECAETFAGAGNILGTLGVLQQMAVLVAYTGALPVVKVGRMAGQFAKPRSQATEVRDGVELPAYRGDMVNGAAFTVAARTPDPARLRDAYHCAAATLNMVRAHTAEPGYTDARLVQAANRAFVAGNPQAQRYGQVLDGIDRVLAFTQTRTAPSAVEVYSSHEALILDYEHALTRTFGPDSLRYDLSAHFIWIGERTRALDGAHIEYARHVQNPIGVKLGPTATSDEALALLDVLDPDREPGRLTFVTRMGADRVRDALPPLVDKIVAEGGQVGWVCDPMHGNTYRAAGGYKSRRLRDVIDEVQGFFEVHRALGTHPGGIHIELTGDDVTECTGGTCVVLESDLGRRYESACDPRLNRTQSLDLAFHVAELLDRH